MKLIIVESPGKIKKIQHYIGSGFIVKASVGHCYEIDKEENAIDIKNNFEPKYVISPKKTSVIKELKEAAKKCDTIYICTDNDREGSAIGWHLTFFALKDLKSKIKRAKFNEITKPAILYAISNPIKIEDEEHMYHSQQARAVLDRLVGYGVSKVLWRKVCKGTSAGRVQSVSLKLIVERQKEIDAFKPEEYWDIEGLFVTTKSDEFKANYVKDGKITNEKDAKNIVASVLGESNWIIDQLDSGTKKRSPFPPFSTSTLQQFAATIFSWPGKKTMSIAQSLYEAGKISYHRTDSFNISEDALKASRDYINQTHGGKYLPSTAKFYKTKSANTQEAHECIRPTDLSFTSAMGNGALDPDQAKLYEAIYRRFVSCQMTDAEFDMKKATIIGSSKKNKFSATGQTMKFDGFLREWTYSSAKEESLPDMKEKEALKLKEVTPSQHFTKPPAAFNDASLIKTLDESGVGRPSTYAGIIDTLVARGYVTREGKAFKAAELGILVCDYLKGAFKNLMDIGYTSRIEESLDKIAEGKDIWHVVVGDFYKELDVDIKKAIAGSSMKQAQDTNIKCPLCGKFNLVLRNSRFGKFYGCKGFLEKGKDKCKATFKVAPDGSPIQKVVNYLKDSSGAIIKCDLCGSKVVIRRGKKSGKEFGGCGGYPSCKRAFFMDGTPIDFKKKGKD
jgi:DNA topoisomerase-1